MKSCANFYPRILKEKTAMSDNPMSKSRRDAIKMMVGGLAAVPLMNLVGMAAAQAEELPHVTADDPTAIALKYVDIAADADRAAAARPGKPPEEQHCANCQFSQGEGEWIPCQLFPGKSVSATGWCASWTLRPGA
jgi:hypothetical protein